MGTLVVVEVDPLCDDPLGFEAVSQLVQVDRLVFERPPEAFDEDIVHAAAPAIHGDRDARLPEHAGEVEAGELADVKLMNSFGAMISHKFICKHKDGRARLLSLAPG